MNDDDWCVADFSGKIKTFKISIKILLNKKRYEKLNTKPYRFGRRHHPAFLSIASESTKLFQKLLLGEGVHCVKIINQ